VPPAAGSAAVVVKTPELPAAGSAAVVVKTPDVPTPPTPPSAGSAAASPCPDDEMPCLKGFGSNH